MIGSKLAHYEITSHLGSGGMGEVYQATDMKLGRSVAIKFLPEAFSHDTERVARFQREARVLASLNHANIAAIYGVEEIKGRHFLVMELVAGKTLADSIKRGAIPIQEALPIARQIAEALEAAHEKGIIHRDLKPANIKLTQDGKVKVLDFGLAKALVGDESSGNLSDSPTLSMAVTQRGVILGTAAYMSPEQARGKTVDKRSDVWAFGCVLYEMLTGRRVFDAGEASDTLAMVLMKEVDWTPLPATTPSAIRTLLRRCLEKDRKRRLPDIGVARLEIDEALAAPAPSMPAAVEAPRPTRQRLAWTIAALASLAALALAGLYSTETSPESPSPIRFSVTPPADMVIVGIGGHYLSPDVRRIAFRVAGVNAGGTVRLAVRGFDEDEVRILVGTEGVVGAFWSPDSRFLAFFTGGKLQKIDITGGPPQVLCTFTAGATAFGGGAWNRDGTILFGLGEPDRKSTRLNSSHLGISYAVFCLKKKPPTRHLRPAGEEPAPTHAPGEHCLHQPPDPPTAEAGRAKPYGTPGPRGDNSTHTPPEPA